MSEPIANICESRSRVRNVRCTDTRQVEGREGPICQGSKEPGRPGGRRFRRASTEGFNNEDDWERDWWRR